MGSDRDLFYQWVAESRANMRAICELVQKGEARRGVLVEALRHLLSADVQYLPVDDGRVWSWKRLDGEIAREAAEIIVALHEDRKAPRVYVGHILALIGRVPDALADALYGILNLADLGEEDCGDSLIFEGGPLSVFGSLLLHDGVPARLKAMADGTMRQMILAELEKLGEGARVERMPVLRAYLRPLELIPFSKRPVDADLYAGQVAFLIALGETVSGNLFGKHAHGLILERLPPASRRSFVDFVMGRDDGAYRNCGLETFRDLERMRAVPGISRATAGRIDAILAARRPHVEAQAASDSLAAVRLNDLVERMR